MATSGAADVHERLAETGVHLRSLIADDPGAMVSATEEQAANNLVAKAVAMLSADPVIAELAAGGAGRAPATERPPSLARDLLISVDLAHRALLHQRTP